MIERRCFANAPDGSRMGYSIFTGPDPARPTMRFVLIHALAMDRTNWTEVIAALPEYAAVLAMDCRGHGVSDAGVGSFGFDQYADDIAAVMDDAGWPDAVIAGCSMGGCAAMAFAARHSRRAEGLLLIDTTAWYGESSVTDWQARADRARAGGMEALLAFQTSRWFSPEFLDRNPAGVRRCIDVFQRNEISAYTRACDMLGHADLRMLLPQITCPTRVIVGEHDYATPPTMAEAICVAILGATREILAGVRHFTTIEAPLPIAEALLGLPNAPTPPPAAAIR
ncbi:alpha/beta fold hydrolase [Acidisphaera sp. L21]|uniref:alpha/beta fold hydrolase n=1 Tax=Acidisphaera sp. L21 TaxID=1641851 RepID=UPI00131BBD9B|nr:alpha/beta hydrolase [Acidisphaera sp. L21]